MQSLLPTPCLKTFVLPITLAGAVTCVVGCHSTPAVQTAAAPGPHTSNFPVEHTHGQPNPQHSHAAFAGYTGEYGAVMPVDYQVANGDPPPIRAAEELPIPHPTAPVVSSLEDLEQMALDANPALAAAGARVQALRGKWLQAGLAPNPTIGYIGEEIGDDGTAGMQGGFASQQFITGGKLGLSQAVVAQEIAKAEMQWEAVRQRVLTDVRIGYYDVLIAQRKMNLAQELVNTSEQAVQASRALVEAKEISVVGLLQAEVEAQSAQILARQAQNEYEAAWRRLSAVLGCPDLAPQRLNGGLRAAEYELNWDDELHRLLTQSPEVAAAVAELERTRWALDRAYAQVMPDVNVQLAVQYDNASGDTVAGVQVGVPIPFWNKNQGGIQQAHNEIAAAQSEMHQVELDLRRRLATAFQNYADARVQVSQYADYILPKARQTLDLVSRGFRAGEVGYLDILTAQRTYFQTNLAYVEAMRDLWRSRSQIDGLLLEGSLVK